MKDWSSMTDAEKKAFFKSVAIRLAIGYGLWKFGPGNLIKAAGAGVIGNVVVASVTGLAGV